LEKFREKTASLEKAKMLIWNSNAVENFQFQFLIATTFATVPKGCGRMWNWRCRKYDFLVVHRVRRVCVTTFCRFSWEVALSAQKLARRLFSLFS